MIPAEPLDDMVSMLKRALDLTDAQADTAREALEASWSDKVAFVWTTQGVIELSRDELGKPITPDEAQAVLFHVQSEYDPQNGVSTKTILETIRGLGFA